MKKNLLNILICFAVLCVAFGFISCSKNVSVEGISFIENYIELYVGDEYCLEYTITPDDATNHNVSFMSSNESVAVIQGDGIVLAISSGNVTVTVISEDGKFSDICFITVQEHLDDDNQDEKQTDEEQKDDTGDEKDQEKDNDEHSGGEKQDDDQQGGDEEQGGDQQGGDEEQGDDQQGGDEEQGGDQQGGDEEQGGDQQGGDEEQDDDQQGGDEEQGDDQQGGGEEQGDDQQGGDEEQKDDNDPVVNIYTVTFIAEDRIVAICEFSEENMLIETPEPPEKYGYTVEWEDYTIALNNIIVYAIYEPISYSVSFVDYEGRIIFETTYTLENASVVDPEVPIREHYNGEWDNYTLSGGDIVVNAIYTPVEYAITFMVNDDIISEQYYNITNMTISVPEVPEREHYSGEWESYSLSLENIIVQAIYTPIEYNVIFVVDDEVFYSQVYTIINTIITEPEVPIHDYYIGEWEDYNLSGGDVTVNAVYTPIDYCVTFMVGDEIISEQYYNITNLEISVPQVPEREFYSGEWEQYNLNFENITVNAIYKAIVYYVYFIDRNNEVYCIVEYTVEDTLIIEPEVPVIDHYYGEWEQYTLNGGDVNVYAVYTPIEYNILFVIKGEVVSTQIYTVEDKDIIIPDIPEIEGYTAEWEDFDLSGGNLIVYAIYTLIPYVITFKVNGLIAKEIIFTVETVSIDEPEVPSIAGYTGLWESYSLKCDDITVNAIYTLINYTITYANTKEAENSNSVSYNVENVFTLEDISVEGYVFEGWYIGDEKINNLKDRYGDLTITAKWSLIEYTIIFTDENRNEIIATIIYTVESTDKLPEVPEKEGYIGSWSAFNLTYSNKPVYVHAVYTKIEE